MSAAATEAQLRDVAARCLMLGIDEVNLTHATKQQFDAIAALGGARTSKQPWHSTAERVWKIFHVASVQIGGVTVTAHWKHLATADDLATVGKLRSVP